MHAPLCADDATARAQPTPRFYLTFWQVAKNARTLAPGSVLCLADRTPLGRIDDVFGPVSSPFYVLRAGGGAGVAPGAAAFSIDRLADTLVTDKLKAKG